MKCNELSVLPINLMVITRGGKDDMRTCFGYGENGDPEFTLSAAHMHGVCYGKKVYAVENHPNDSRVTVDPDGITQTLSSRMGTGGNNTPLVLITSTDVCSQSDGIEMHVSVRQEDPTETDDLFVTNSSGDGIASPLDASYYKGQGIRQGIEREFVVMEKKRIKNWDGTDVSGTLTVRNAGGCQRMPDKDNFIAVIEERMHYYTKQSHSEFINGSVASSIKNRDYKDFTDIVQEVNMENQDKKYVLRRLTPTECARLQGFPDWWVDGANGSDSAQYKLWGNGVALPCVAMILENIAEDMKHE